MYLIYTSFYQDRTQNAPQSHFCWLRFQVKHKATIQKLLTHCHYHRNNFGKFRLEVKTPKVKLILMNNFLVDLFLLGFQTRNGLSGISGLVRTQYDLVKASLSRVFHYFFERNLLRKDQPQLHSNSNNNSKYWSGYR